MAYCKNCGAYIPDGQSKCLACGYDENPEPVNSGSSAAAAQDINGAFNYRDTHDDLKARLEEQRKAQQEAQRRLAEQEYARRQKQEEDRRWAQEEYARRQEERQRQAREEQERREREAAERRSAPQFGAGSQNSRVLGALSYLGVLCVLPFLFGNGDSNAQFHGKQGIRLLVFSVLADVLSVIPFGFVFTLARLYFIYKGISNALNGRNEPLPWIGTIGEK